MIGMYNTTTTFNTQMRTKPFVVFSQCYMLLSNAVVGFADVFPWRLNVFFLQALLTSVIIIRVYHIRFVSLI